MPRALLQAIAGLAEDELYAAIGRLQAAEFLYETSLFPDVEYTFKHALTHEVAYGSLLQERRRALHGRAVEVIEGLYPARLAEHVERLAHHALRGEVWEKDVPVSRVAAWSGPWFSRPHASGELTMPRRRCPGGHIVPSA